MLKWQKNVKLAALAGFAVCLDKAAMDFNQLLDDGQTDAGAAALFVAGFVGPVKMLEDEWQVCRSNTASVVADGDLQPVAASA